MWYLDIDNWPDAVHDHKDMENFDTKTDIERAP